MRKNFSLENFVDLEAEDSEEESSCEENDDGGSSVSEEMIDENVKECRREYVEHMKCWAQGEKIREERFENDVKKMENKVNILPSKNALIPAKKHRSLISIIKSKDLIIKKENHILKICFNDPETKHSKNHVRNIRTSRGKIGKSKTLEKDADDYMEKLKLSYEKKKIQK